MSHSRRPSVQVTIRYLAGSEAWFLIEGANGRTLHVTAATAFGDAWARLMHTRAPKAAPQNTYHQCECGQAHRRRERSV